MTTVLLWLVRIGFVLLIYLVLLLLVRALWRDLRSAARMAGSSLGRLVVVASPHGQPEEGTSIPLDAVATLGSEVNNTIVVDDDAVSPEHALLTFRGQAWYLEDRGTPWGTRVNGRAIQGAAILGYGDEIRLGDVRLRLERPPTDARGDPV